MFWITVDLLNRPPFLPVGYRELVADDAFMFPDPPAGLDKFGGPKGEHRIEYLRLMLREMRSGKTELRDEFRGGGTIFAVGKTGGKQRAVWDGKRVTGIAASPPKPPHLASPAALQDVEIRPGHRLRMWKRDGKCLFDKLRLPAALVPFMGRPPFTIREFCVATSISIDSAREFWRGRGALALDTVVYPVGRVWAMGFGWSSWVSQCVMLDTCYAAGLGEDMVLAEDHPIPSRSSSVFCVATDDIVLLSSEKPRRGREAVRRLDREFVPQHLEECLEGCQRLT